VSLLVAAAFSGIGAQPRGLAADEGYVGLGLALRKLQTVAIFMQAVAHPDDENNGLHVLLNRGQGVRTTLVTLTRGDGGQNEIGPELGDALGVLRTSELLSLHRFDGTEQYFTRAVDFGYSFGIEETFEKWGREQIVGDMVRLIRTIRPDDILTMNPEGTGGGQHHQASARIVTEAFRAAADPGRFPEQLKEGLRPWQARKLFYMQGFGGGRGGGASATPPNTLRVDHEVWDPLLGNTYAYIGSESRSMHKCQGMGQLLALPRPSAATYTLADSEDNARDKTGSLFEGIDTTIPGLSQYVRGPAPAPLTTALASIAQSASAAMKAFETQGVAATVAPIVEGLGRVRAARAGLAQMGLDESARFEIDYRLKTKEAQLEDAALLAEGLHIEVLADDGQVVAGQMLTTRVVIANRGAEPVEVKRVTFDGLTGDTTCAPATIAARSIYQPPGATSPECSAALRVPADARLTSPYWKRLPDAERYEFEPDAPFGAPFRPTPFRARIQLTIHGVDVETARPVQYRYEGNVFSGEKRMELQVVPAMSVRITPDITIVPTVRTGPPAGTRPASAGNQAVAPDEREVRVSVTNGNRGAGEAAVSLQLPQGWQADPARATIAFVREDEAQTVRFKVKPLTGTPSGAYRVKAIVQAGGATFDRGYQVIEYQHIERRQMIVAAEATIKLIDVKVRPNLTIGYVMGVGDQVPPALEQLGARVSLLSADDLAWGNLSRYDAIVTGVRAYERRDDLRAHNQRLLDYVQNGGTLIVQYNKTEFNQAQYGPYPARVGSSRITDERAPVQVLQPDNPIFTTPNAIGPSAWQGWGQERGLYFLGEKDPRYVDLVQMEDPFPYNSGVKRGALVEATYGKGHWIYVGLGLWRQLPAGTDGAYRLFANLISLR
jgi:LmbE family N-acetylglucosaminyl deacetylase